MMKKEYDLSNMKSRKNPYVTKLKLIAWSVQRNVESNDLGQAALKYCGAKH